jgi:PIN domain nuclease of toxin-antitoxin system
MSKVVLDASALLALIKNEPGAEIVEGLLGNIVMSSVNVSEIASILLDSDMNTTETQESIEPFIDSIVSFDFEHSIACASLKKITKHLGLSLGDRACIALGIKLKLPIYTADKIWQELKLENTEIKLIR